VNHQIDRRHTASDGKPAAKVGLGLLQHGIVLPLGDGQMRDDLVELPAERRGFRPPVRDRLGEPTERNVRFGDEIQDPRESPAVLEPDLEGPVTPDHFSDGSASTVVDAALVEKREEDGDMGRNTRTG
jgi:hypothetical protein